MQPWAARLLETLGACLGSLDQPVRALDLADDRLAATEGGVCRQLGA